MTYHFIYGFNYLGNFLVKFKL